jgi:predicted ATPase with chaperone activity
MNPCPCGFANDFRKECFCTPPQIQRYMSKISGPLMDRIDIQIDVPAVPYKELSTVRGAESSESIRSRVVAARSIQLRRFYDEHIYTNAQMGPRQLRKYCVLTPECEKIMENAVTKLGFSARGYDRILKRIRTTRCGTVRLTVPIRLEHKPKLLTCSQVARVLGISANPLRWRMRIGMYPRGKARGFGTQDVH